VKGLPSVEHDAWEGLLGEEWDALKRACDEEMAYLAKADTVMESIEANRWAEDGAEEYNFLDTAGGTVAMPDIKRAETAVKHAIKRGVKIDTIVNALSALTKE